MAPCFGSGADQEVFYTDSLKEMVGCLPESVSNRVEWIPEYRNQDISHDVFDRVDAIVVPSIWVENSPLVIHEAQQARIPVITADVGGMAEYVKHEVNGLLFRHRSFESLAGQMQRFVDNPDYARNLGQKGYLYSGNGDIPSIEDHTVEIESIYKQAIKNLEDSRVSKMPGPWRLTLDTNPDRCNLRCIMCEEHSPHSDLQNTRRKEGRPRREMTPTLIRKAVAEAAASGQLRELIPSTMGEPLLFEHFDEILSLCDEYSVKLNLTTNGTFPRLGATEWAKKIVPLASDVKISWNGATKETQEAIMLGSNWQIVLNNVREFIAVRDEFKALGHPSCRVTFQLTFLETNIEELADIVHLAIELCVDRVKGHHLWAHFEEIKELSMRRDSESIIRWNKAVESALSVAQQHKLPNGEYIELENIYTLDNDASETLIRESYCPFLGQEAWVSAEGRFNPCCAPDAQRLDLGEFGNLNDDKFNEIWNGEAYEALIATYSNHSLCLGCNMRKPTFPV